MIRHTVLFRFKNSLRQEEIQQIANHLEKMREKIPQIKNFEWLTNTSDHYGHGFLHGISMVFNNAKDLEDYITHPHHVDVTQSHLFPALKNGTDDLIVFDHKLR